MEKQNDTLSVWLVEDNNSYRETVAMVVDQVPGMRCTGSFHSGERLLNALAHYDHPDIILSDINMPGIGGIEMVRRTKIINPDIHVVMLTVHDEDDKVFDAICSGATGYLLKTASDLDIREAIELVVSGGAPVNARIARKVLHMFSQIRSPRQEYNLTEREQEILTLIVEGQTKKAIAIELNISFHTVDSHLRHIYEKLHVNCRSDAVAKAVKENLV